MSKAANFKKELKALLSKYDASISFNVSECSDTYGLSGERIEVYLADTKTIVLAEGWGVDKNDL